MTTATSHSKNVKKATKATKKATGKIHMGLLLDESGSMSHLVREVVGGTNEFVNALRGEENAERVRVTLGMFDSNRPIVRYVAAAEKLSEFGEITDGDYRPNAGTPLYDAIIETVEKIGGSMKKKDKALLVIYTDGYENASVATAETVKSLIEAKERAGWTFVFLGADLDARGAGGAIGITNTSQTTGTSKGTRSSLTTSANMGVAYLADSGVLPDMYRGAKKINEDGEIEDEKK